MKQLNSMKRTLALFVVVAVAVSTATTFAEEWGSLKGKFIFDGKKIPTAKKITPTKDTAVCGKHQLMEETLIVGKEGGIKNVLVYLTVKKGKKVAVHESYEKTAKDEVVLDNKGCRFEPHILLMRTTQTLIVQNDDPVGHNTKCEMQKNSSFNEIIKNGGKVKKVFKKEETYPAPVGCNIHPWMAGYIVIRNNPYMALSAEDGTFEIKNLPAGEYEFAFWQENAGNLKKLKVGGKTASRKGRVKLTIPAGKTLDLGDIKVSPKILKVK